MENESKQYTPNVGERCKPIRHKYKGELQLCQEALHTSEAEKKIWRTVGLGALFFAAIVIFLLVSTLKGNNALQQKVNDAKIVRIMPNGIVLKVPFK